MEIAELLDKAGGYLPSEKVALVEEAYQFALEAHEGQTRRSGEPYLQHPLEAASILTDLRLDASSLAAALLHDVVEDCDVPLSQIEETFGPEVGKLVDGVTKLNTVSWSVTEKPSHEDLQAESMRKMLVAMAEDLRVVFIKLADRLHNMRTLAALPPAKRRAIARETLEIYAPLAHRLGIVMLRTQLEDLGFLYLEPVKYRQTRQLLAKQEVSQEKLIDRITETLRAELTKTGVKGKISGRSKGIFSLHRKIQTYAAQGKDISDIHDVIAVRVIVSKVEECYHALGVVHSLWHPLSDEFNDYIATPKRNGYRSLHTTVMCYGTPIEIQIRTQEMHYASEYGMAAHWRYKEGAKQDLFEQRISGLRQLLEWHGEISGTREFLESVKTDILRDQVFVYTPKGEIRDLPAGSTVVDFAYHIHTDLGHRCIGAKVNGKLVSLTSRLRNGDTVEIVVGKKDKGPSRDWLNPNLGYVNTSHARGRVRQWFRKQARSENIEKGKEILEKELRRLGVSLSNREDIALLFKYDNIDDFHATIGYGEINPIQIVMKMATQIEQPRVSKAVPETKSVPAAVRVLGTGDLLTQLAPCCHPLPGDQIIGYITRSRGVTIHRKDCPNIARAKERERLVPVDWGKIDKLYQVVVRIDAWDRMGLLRDISALVAEERINIGSVSTKENEDNSTSIYLSIEIRSIAQLSRLLSKIEG
ncbi:MAG: bifunctional (p)ppGpp synthetase/guanosine-3',5'-bis(diphosphate) 3'-pyrophosphohydrolase, partial [Chloroflexi bacterium]|nr:bifunctional (p)ppGpp synthetase/guanosine-3',5'-bis(diphosphate) 3'-pyrophosphohydrolase [Chloroflexota bacterium]